jgi:hypothetical protein
MSAYVPPSPASATKVTGRRDASAPLQDRNAVDAACDRRRVLERGVDQGHVQAVFGWRVIATSWQPWR